jgi:FkbM family methyltransferase
MYNPNFAFQMINAGVFKNHPFIIMDIGARNGAESIWTPLGDQLQLICFEPDAEHCDLLNRSTPNTHSYYPIALSDIKRVATLNVSQNLLASSLLDVNNAFVDRFPHSEPGRIVKQVEVETVDLDSFCDQYQIQPIDFIKIDVEGAELMVLKGGKRTIDKSVLGISLEVWFHEYHNNRPLFSDIDIYLRSQGFSFFDFLQMEKWSRKTIATNDQRSWYSGGQLMWANALYLRDIPAVSSTLEKKSSLFNRTSLVKLAVLGDLFNLRDFSIEVIRTAKEFNFISAEEANSCETLLKR